MITYTYDNRRRLSNLAVNSGNTTIMDNDYTFDAVSNVLSVANNASLPASGNAGGKMSHAYTYDGLYRLASATGTYMGADNKSASYTLAMGYDNMHRITSKSQHLTQDNVQFNGTLNVGYDLTYTYGTEDGKKFQLASVKDVNYRTEETPGDNNIENNHVYLYDKNGNLVYVNTGRLMNDGHNETCTGERKLIWDEENRLLAVDDNGFVSNYWYDADGERTVKTSGESDQVYVNGVFSGGSTNTAKFSLYVSPYLVANQGGRYTKHIYAGSQRIVSKIGDFASYGSDPRRIEYAGANTDGLSVDYKAKYAAQQQVIKDNYKFFDVPYNGTDNDNYADGEGFCCNDGSMEAAMARTKVQARAVARSFKDPDNYENLQFFYHPDYLGSSSFITNLEGEVVQHIEYVPFGEVFIEERNSVWNTPYLFNAKEFDEETGMYYYGARYYEPRLSIWLSTDPKEEKFAQWSSYTYTLNNPLNLIDRDGKEGIVVSGQHGGTMHGSREHFLINGLDRAKRALNRRKSKSEKVTWIIYSEKDTDLGYTEEELSKYKKLAQKEGIGVTVVNNPDKIIDYINDKNGGTSRQDDKITSFYYVGHATPGDLNVGYNGGLIFDGDEFDADQLHSDAFAKGAWINVTAACRTAVGAIFEKSIVDQFAEKLDKTSTIYGSNVRTFFGGGVQSDEQLLKKNNGKQIMKNGKK